MKVYRIHINSDDKISGSFNNSFYYINLGTIELDKDYDWFLSIETFVINQISPSLYLDPPYIICLPDVSMKSTSYSTLDQGVKNIILLSNLSTYNNSITCDSTGNHVANVNQFDGKVMRVQMLDSTTGEPYVFPDVNDTNTIKWSMILVLHGMERA